mmetsp:Transcript_5622/g.13013  ORF Transcript_5622/g.13013 Transcript_5622/m.13013 type:complete len:207 (+) Transcript_5622:978-1598(+)
MAEDHRDEGEREERHQHALDQRARHVGQDEHHHRSARRVLEPTERRVALLQRSEVPRPPHQRVAQVKGRRQKEEGGDAASEVKPARARRRRGGHEGEGVRVVGEDQQLDGRAVDGHAQFEVAHSEGDGSQGRVEEAHGAVPEGELLGGHGQHESVRARGRCVRLRHAVDHHAVVGGRKHGRVVVWVWAVDCVGRKWKHRQRGATDG